MGRAIIAAYMLLTACTATVQSYDSLNLYLIEINENRQGSDWLHCYAATDSDSAIEMAIVDCGDRCEPVDTVAIVLDGECL